LPINIDAYSGTKLIGEELQRRAAADTKFTLK